LSRGLRCFFLFRLVHGDEIADVFVDPGIERLDPGATVVFAALDDHPHDRLTGDQSLGELASGL
jgi:hypothetical protein